VNSRAINQAIGVIRARTGVCEVAAFEWLRHTSQSTNMKLYVVAQQYVEDAVRRAKPDSHP
jgi:AmiR/NasT family two-component response regulator